MKVSLRSCMLRILQLVDQVKQMSILVVVATTTVLPNENFVALMWLLLNQN